MNVREFQIRAVPAPWHSGIEILVRDDRHIGKIIMEPIEDIRFINPTLTLDLKQAQVLMDDLWAAGIRPTEGTGSAGSLRATEKHLEDMRTIVFHQMGIKITDK